MRRRGALGLILCRPRFTSLVTRSHNCQQVLTIVPTQGRKGGKKSALRETTPWDFRSPPVRQIFRLSAVSSSECSTYGLKSLKRNIFTHFKHDATVRPYRR